MKRVLPLFFIALFLFGALSVPRMVTGMHVSVEISQTEGFSEQQLMSALPAQYVDRPIRVAIYDEDNLTVPAISDASDLTNNLAEVTTLLEGAGHSVVLLTEEDILNHELITADYDVFIIINNVPKPSISKLVKDFWLGGGGLMTFHGAVSYLWYEGFIIADLNYDVGNQFWWGYFSSDSQNVTSRHSTMKEYHVNDTVYERADLWATSWEPKLIEGRGDDMVFLMNNATQADFITAFAIDNSNYGGRIVQLPGDGSSIPTDFESIIIDSVVWLNPRPKGKIAFDLSHQPRRSLDLWDGGDWPDSYSDVRDIWVNHSYTVDKIHPSTEGNLTLERISKYDALMIVLPDYNFTQQEVDDLISWVNEGGSLFLIGEAGTAPFNMGNEQLNRIMAPMSMQLNLELTISGTISTDMNGNHPTTEGCVSVSIGYRGYINITGNANEICYTDSDVWIAGNDYGNGRVIVQADMNWITNDYLADDDNIQFAINAANWLTSSTADVLLFTDEPDSASYHRTPVADALNDLGIPFALTFTFNYLNLSLYSQSWDLVIIDSPWVGLNAYGNQLSDSLCDYLDTQGELLMSWFRVDPYPSLALWAKMGFEFAGDMPDELPVHIWDSEHNIFNIPNGYGVANFTPIRDYGDEGDLLTVFDNATALAGNQSAEVADGAIIVLRNDEKALYNGYLIDQFTGDLDDSTYQDSFELWENEIAFMMRPTIDSPGNMQFEGGSTGHTITWHPSSWSPAEFTIRLNGEVAQAGAWFGESIVFNVDNLQLCSHQVLLEVSDSAGSEIGDEVTVLVEDTTLPTIDSPLGVTVAAGAAVSVTWVAYDLFPDSYRLLVNGTEELDEEWDGATVAVNVENLEIGVYNFTMEVVDTSGNRASDTVMVTVTAGIAGFDSATLLLIAAVGVVLVVVVIVVLKKRGAGAST